MKSRRYSYNITNAIREYLIHDEWCSMFSETSDTFRFSITLYEMLEKIDYEIQVKETEYIVYAISPLSADISNDSMMANLGKFFCRVSYGISNGNFELNCDNGEIRYKSFVDCDGEIMPTQERIRNSLYYPAVMFKRYAAGIVSIVLASFSAERAIAMCDGLHIKRLASMFSDDSNEVEESASFREDIDEVNMDLFGLKMKCASALLELAIA